MSWTPQIWIKRSDYDSVAHLLECYAWAFNIAEHEGVVLSGGETSSRAYEVEDVLKSNKIEHWILNGEGGCCSLSHAWGNKLFDPDDEV